MKMNMFAYAYSRGRFILQLLFNSYRYLNRISVQSKSAA